jgi:hypothetical protein
MQGLHVIIFLSKHLALEVGLMPMSPSSISFLVLSSGRSVTCNGEKYIRLACFAKFENYGNNFSQFRSLDVL